MTVDNISEGIMTVNKMPVDKMTYFYLPSIF
jgi:hypothetical protein